MNQIAPLSQERTSVLNLAPNAPKLSQEQVQYYRDNGYVKASGILSDDEVRTLVRVTDEFVEKSRSVTASDKVFDVEDTHTAENPRLRRLKRPEDQHPAYAALFQHPGLLNVLRQLLGPDVRHKGLKLNLKPPSGGEPVEWHQDWAFYPHTNDDLLVLAIMLDDVTEENGPLMVVPGSHKGPVLDHHQEGWFVGAVANPDEATGFITKAVPLHGKVGDITVHHARTLHGSASNLSKHWRRLLFVTAMAADAWPLNDSPTDMAAYDARIIAGKPTIMPRLANVPARLPLPRRLKSGESIFEKQRDVRFTPFERVTERRPGRGVEMMDA